MSQHKHAPETAEAVAGGVGDASNPAQENRAQPEESADSATTAQLQAEIEQLRHAFVYVGCGKTVVAAKRLEILAHGEIRV